MDTYTVDLESMGKRIRELRNTQNKTQEVFADMIHISSSYLALIEQGKRTCQSGCSCPDCVYLPCLC